MIPVMEAAIVLAGIVLCFYASSVNPHGMAPVSPQAAIADLMNKINHDPKALDDIGREIYRQHYGD